MARTIRTHYDFGGVAEIRNALAHLLNTAPGSPNEGQFYFDTATKRFRVYHGATDGWQSLLPANTRLDQIAAPTASVSLNSQKITSLANGTNPSDAVTVQQLETAVGDAVSGLDTKESVRAATTGNITLSGAQTVDGVSVIAGDRVLVKSQTSGAENGIYVAAAGAWARATDADAWDEMVGAFVFVEEGTTLGDTGWVSTADAGGTLDTTTVTWTQFSSSASITAGAGLTKTGSVLDVVAASGSGIVVNTDNIDIDPVGGLPVNRGGTGAITAAGARTNLGATGKYAATIGDGTNNDIVVTHNLGTRDVVVSVHDATAYDEIECDVVKTSTNTITLSFVGPPPATNSLRVTVIG